jgi:hypothetical protein
MMRFPTDPFAIVLALGSLVVIAIAGVSAWRTGIALRTAFVERLGELPGAGVFERLKRKFGFWSRVTVHALLLLALIAIVFGAGRLVWRALTV